ncbi:MAG TPA: lasso peptide biosynthesis PqqD family chaperone [Herpetosiphonaceae bacterium]
MISKSAVVVATKEQVSSDLEGEAVILNLKNGMYYGLDAIGSRIWELLQQPQSVAALRDAIMAEYDVDAERCERDLLALLNNLAEVQLIEVSDVAAA